MRRLRLVQILLLVAALFIGPSAAEDITPDDIMEEMGDAIVITGISVAVDDEWVELANAGMLSQEFTFWTLIDEKNNTYSFPEGFVLDPGATVKVHTTLGNNTETDLFWGREDPVWDDGEMATLIDANGEIVAIYPPAS
ncbi:lamin tail domain-containing protein [Candidatus Methanocrinis natronophilus]|uniref:lamin tail domain-containing protein n=1 Tax=Candidatus Methanocrinis natronophilus TaxID=3033396 RepID=UPI00293528A2|nr:lamin tail domain-containing protein [Candidatus Methanocrinis natronophilus]